MGYRFFFKISIPEHPLHGSRPESLQKDLEVELDRADGVRQLELVQNGRVQDAEDADGVVLAGQVDLDGRCVAGEESLVCTKNVSVCMSSRKRWNRENVPSTSSIQ